VSAHAASPAELQQRKEKYIRVFWVLCALTAIELAIVWAGKAFPVIPQMIIVLGIVLFSAGKAVVVGYSYMHLEHETKWLKFVACLPVIAFLYAFFLVNDVKHDRPFSVYRNEPSRIYPPLMLDRKKHSSHADGHAAAHADPHSATHSETDSKTEEKQVIEFNDKSSLKSPAPVENGEKK